LCKCKKCYWHHDGDPFDIGEYDSENLNLPASDSVEESIDEAMPPLTNIESAEDQSMETLIVNDDTVSPDTDG
jgi:hypothetical protein